jgi:hypothetical protein
MQTKLEYECKTCVHRLNDHDEEPCLSCDDKSEWEPDRERVLPRPDEIFPTRNQSRCLYERLVRGPVTNAEMRDQLRLLSYTRRLSDIREKLPDGWIIKKKHKGDGVFSYRLEKESKRP